MRLLLISPRFPESFWSFRWAITHVLPGKRALNPPLGLATLAALCPAQWQVEIIDENIEPCPPAPHATIVGVCGMGVQHRRQKELLSYYRQRGYYVVAGGSYASLCPGQYKDVADTIVAGEAEYIWSDFCRDFEAGTPKRLYQESGVVDLSDSPIPRFELLKLDKYNAIGLQFSRGCPYRCDFCDIIVMFGRRPRTKSPEQVGRELDVLRSLGVRNLFFVDDNFIGNKGRAKKLLGFLRDYQSHHHYQFDFGTEASLNIAEDDELLRLFTEAGFSWVFIGIESPDEQSLRETKKTQNARLDALAAVRKIHTRGINILAGFIIGFDNDTLETFNRQFRFIMASGIQVAMVGLLTALPRTPLYERLEGEGRLITGAEHSDNTRPGTNFVPKGMGYEDMVQNYKALYRRLWSDHNIAARIQSKSRYLTRPVPQNAYKLHENFGMLGRLLLRGLIPGGMTRLFLFTRTLVTCAPRAWAQVIHDWVTGLATRDYIQRYFGLDPLRDTRMVHKTMDYIRRKYASNLHRGALEISLRTGATGPLLIVTLRDAVDRHFFTHATRRFEKLLRKSAVTLSLNIDGLRERQMFQLEHLLTSLSRYGDRIAVRLGDGIPALLSIDATAFRLIPEDLEYRLTH